MAFGQSGRFLIATFLLANFVATTAAHAKKVEFQVVSTDGTGVESKILRVDNDRLVGMTGSNGRKTIEVPVCNAEILFRIDPVGTAFVNPSAQRPCQSRVSFKVKRKLKVKT
jgi:hypothetical protein